MITTSMARIRTREAANLGEMGNIIIGDPCYSDGVGNGL